MKLKVNIEGAETELELSQENGRVTARVGDRLYELETDEPEPGVFLFKHRNAVHEAFVSRSETPDSYRVTVGNDELRVTVSDPRRLRGSAADREAADGLVQIKTAMPGRVVRILASAGDVVEKGTAVIVVEAMKMQNELRSPKSGVIRNVLVKEGATVNAGEILLVIE